MSKILVVTSGSDVTATIVIEELENRGVHPIRFDTNLFQKDVRLSVRMDKDGNYSGYYCFPEGRLAFEDVDLVWFRRVGQPTLDESLENNPQLKEWVSEECIGALSVALSLMKAPIVNPYKGERPFENKWKQMIAAAEVGFEVPCSCLTSILPDIRSFWEEVEEEMIFKPIARGLRIMADGRRLLIQTNRVPPDKMTAENLERMRFAPMFIQRHIPKRYDIRSVIIGEHVFSFAIHSQEVEEAKVDYRKAFLHGGQKKLRHEFIHLGSEVDGKLIKIVKGFGDYFGVVDLIETPDGRLVFLENNPEGQWAWLQQETGVPVAVTMADYLLNVKRE